MPRSLPTRGRGIGERPLLADGGERHAQPAPCHEQLDALGEPHRPGHERCERQADHHRLHDDVGRREHRPRRKIARQVAHADDARRATRSGGTDGGACARAWSWWPTPQAPAAELSGGLSAQCKKQHDAHGDTRKQAASAAPRAGQPGRIATQSISTHSSRWLLVDKMFCAQDASGSKAIRGDNLNAAGPHASAQ